MTHHWIDWAWGFMSGVMVAVIIGLAMQPESPQKPPVPRQSVLPECRPASPKQPQQPTVTPPAARKPAKTTRKAFVSDWEYWKTVPALVTAYEPGRRSCWPYADGKTSIGKNAWRMTGVAAHPDAIPYGAGVDVPGIGWRVVDDTGKAMRRSWSKGIYHIDVRMKTVWEANQWGRKKVRVKLYKRKATR